MQIGFFDSGIGGITVLHEALRMLPNENYIYYADTLNVPYGTKTKDEVRKCIFDAVDFIESQGVKALVIACNTATSVAVKDLRKRYSFPIIGMEPAVKPAVENSKRNKRVLVFATNLTLKEEKFMNLVARVDNEHIVDFLPLPGLVEFAEKFDFSEESIIPYLKEILSSFDMKQYGTIVLGCTHFPYFKNMFKRIVPKDIDIIDGGYGTVKNLKSILNDMNRMNEGSGNIDFYISGTRIEEKEMLKKYNGLLQMLNEME